MLRSLIVLLMVQGGMACAGQNPTIQELVQGMEPVTCSVLKGVGEGALEIQQEMEEGIWNFHLRDANGQRDTFTFRVEEDGTLNPITDRNLMTFWVTTDDITSAVEAFVRGGFYYNPVPLTTGVVMDGHYDAIAVLQEGARVTIAVFSSEGTAVYANVPEGGAAFFGVAREAFDGLVLGDDRNMSCCVTCGPTSKCCCDGGDSCATDDVKQEATCFKGGKPIERCWCRGSSCGCQLCTADEPIDSGDATGADGHYTGATDPGVPPSVGR